MGNSDARIIKFVKVDRDWLYYKTDEYSYPGYYEEDSIRLTDKLRKKIEKWEPDYGDRLEVVWNYDSDVGGWYSPDSLKYVEPKLKLEERIADLEARVAQLERG